MGLLDLLLWRRGTPMVAPAPPPREVDVRGCHTVVTFDDGSQLRTTHYGQWTEEERIFHPKERYDLLRTGVFFALQFRDGTDPITLHNGVAYPRHRVRRYDLEAFAHFATASYTPKRTERIYPYLPEPTTPEVTNG